MADTTTPTPSRPCNRCKEKPAVHDLRGAERVCSACFAAFVAQKNMKRIEVMQRETRDARAGPPGAAAAGRGPPPPQRYLLALSGGPASGALLHLLSENLAAQRRAKGGRQRPRFELLVVHVDTENLGPYDDEGDDDEAETENEGAEAEPKTARDPLLAPYRARYPDLSFLRVSLADALTLRTVDWTALFPDAPSEEAGEATTAADASSSSSSSSAARRRATRLAWLLGHGGGLAAPSSRADVRRLLVRHVLLATAARARCDVVLLGCTTTALAELTLAETAKGRGFALPWLVNDGGAPVPASLAPPSSGKGAGEEDPSRPPPPAAIPVYSPLRDLLRAEIATYHTTLDPPLADLFFGPHGPSSTTTTTTNTVVSHKDLSIDDVMRRYFADVELAYPSVVANVVRTTGKLVRDDGNNEGEEAGAVRLCGLCGVGRDEAGDARWRGELGEPAPDPVGGGGPAGSGRSNGEETRAAARRLCYGCERSVYG